MTTPNSQPENETSHRLATWFPTFRLLATWKFWRRALAVLVGLITLVALFYAVENLRGSWAWNRTKERLRAQGEILDIRKLAPPVPPDAENMAMAEPFRKFFDYQYDPKTHEVQWAEKSTLSEPLLSIYFEEPVYRAEDIRMLPSDAEERKTAEWAERYGLALTNSADAVLEDRPKPRPLKPELGLWPHELAINWEEWAEYYRLGTSQLTNHAFASPAKDADTVPSVLEALNGYAETYRQIRTACGRPKCRFPVHYEEGLQALLPHVGKLRNSSRYCVLKARAHLALGETEDAFEALQTGICLAQATAGEPLLISQLVRYANWNTLMAAIWDGMHSHQWTRSQLRQLIDQFASVNLIEDYQFGVRGERAFLVQVIENEPAETLRTISDLSTPWAELGWHLIPKGWFLQNLKRLSLHYQDLIEKPVDAKTRRLRPESTRRVEHDFESDTKSATPYNFLARIWMPSMERMILRTAAAQNRLHLAGIAARLELYYREHGKYPSGLEPLESLGDGPLPLDVLTGQPFRYRAIKDGAGYQLYSIGWDLADDHGEPARDEQTQEPEIDQETGDWIWPSP